jgi:gas vesicle protein
MFKELLFEFETYYDNYKYINPFSKKTALIGGAIGAGGSVGLWSLYRLKLNKKLKLCGVDQTCINNVKNKIKSLNKKFMIGGIGATLGGGLIGGVSGSISGLYDVSNINKEREKLGFEKQKYEEDSAKNYMNAWKVLHPEKYPEYKNLQDPEKISDNYLKKTKEYDDSEIKIGKKNVELGQYLKNKYDYNPNDEFHVLNTRFDRKK